MQFITTRGQINFTASIPATTPAEMAGRRRHRFEDVKKS
jgi:hypothetical protein